MNKPTKKFFSSSLLSLDIGAWEFSNLLTTIVWDSTLVCHEAFAASPYHAFEDPHQLLQIWKALHRSDEILHKRCRCTHRFWDYSDACCTFGSKLQYASNCHISFWMNKLSSWFGSSLSPNNLSVIIT